MLINRIFEYTFMDILIFSRQIDDHRLDRQKLHSVESILFIAISAVICGAESWYEIEEFGKNKESFFRSHLSDFNGIPSHDTFNRFFSTLDPVYFERQFRSWVQSLCSKYEGLVPIDGKTIRSSHKYLKGKKKFKLHMVSAWAAENGISMGQVKVSDKSNEIKAIPRLIRALSLEGCLVSIDAMGCQKKIAEAIIKKKADYLLCVKANQEKLYQDIKNHFDSALQKRKPHEWSGHVRYDFYRTEEKRHGRKEIRECVVYSNGMLDKVYKEWKGLCTFVRITSERTEVKSGKKSMDTRYYITSLKMDAKRIAEAVRGHWSIENNLHWQLDVSFNEDQTKKRNKAAQNFSLICKMVLMLLKKEPKKLSIKAKRKAAGWSEQYLESIILPKT